MVEIPDDVAKQVAEFLRSTEGHPDDNAAAERWADLLDPQPPTLREQVARGTRASLGGMVEWLAEVVVDTRDALRAGGCAEHFLTAEQVGALEAATRILSRERNADPSRYDLAVAERDDWRRRYEALRDAVLALCDAPDGAFMAAYVLVPRIREVVARVEGDEGA